MYLIYMIMEFIQEKGEYFLDHEDKKNKYDDFCASDKIMVASKMINLFIAEHFPKKFVLMKEGGVDFVFLGMLDD